MWSIYRRCFGGVSKGVIRFVTFIATELTGDNRLHRSGFVRDRKYTAVVDRAWLVAAAGALCVRASAFWVAILPEITINLFLLFYFCCFVLHYLYCWGPAAVGFTLVTAVSIF